MQHRIINDIITCCSIIALLTTTLTLHSTSLELLRFDADLRAIIELDQKTGNPDGWTNNEIGFEEACEILDFATYPRMKEALFKARTNPQSKQDKKSYYNVIKHTIQQSLDAHASKPAAKIEMAAKALTEWLDSAPTAEGE